MRLVQREADRSRAVASRAARAESHYDIGHKLDNNAQPPDGYGFGSVIVSDQRSFGRVHLWCSWCWLIFILRHAPIIITSSILLVIAVAGWLVLL